MKICRFRHNSTINFGLIREDSIFPIENIDDLVDETELISRSAPIPKSSVKILPPSNPSKIVCVGRNYSEHAKELGNEVPKEPLLFLKAPSAIISENEFIEIPPHSDQVEHEGELGVILKRNCKDLAENGDPLTYVLGYICLNDVTARDLQRRDVQFTRAKSFDTFCPLSSFVETELDTTDIRVTTRVNGIMRQDARTSQMVFPVPFLIRYISNQMTLKAGDIIATGTPAGVSKLNPGDICEVEIEGIGVLRNPVKQTEKL